MSNSALLKSSLAKKYWMAFTGLFLCLFLVGHLAGNLQLLMPDAQTKFNEYAKFMTSNPAIKIMSYLTYISILFHAVDGIMLAIQNKKARPVNYAFNKPSANSKWASRKMALLGTLILVFIVLHMKSFWFEMHFNKAIPMQDIDGVKHKDLYTVVKEAFSQVWYVAIYVVSMAVLALHLSHGFQSAFQSLGLNHKKYTPMIMKVGMAFAIIVSLLFAIIPVFMFINK